MDRFLKNLQDKHIADLEYDLDMLDWEKGFKDPKSVLFVASLLTMYENVTYTPYELKNKENSII